jgi:hypothetical protein
MNEAPAYCPFYCEENIWQLCADQRGLLGVGGDRRVLMISNAARRVAMWGQRISSDPELPVVWDYHVIMLLRRGGLWNAWDLDARDPTPRPATRWLEDSFRETGLLPRKFEPRFRLVTCADYLRYFRSDRRHMLGPDGLVMQPAPSWAPIMGESVPGYDDDGSNLDRFLDCEDPEFIGDVLDLHELRGWLAEAETAGLE